MLRAPSFKRASLWLVAATSVAFAVSALAGGCAASNTKFEETNPSTSTTSTGAQGGSGGASSQGGSGGMPSPCDIDCSTIQAPQCQLAQCNTTTRQCEIVPEVDGGTCDDGVFCTADDTCLAGICTAGPPNTCGMTPAPCQSVNCNESGQTCNFASLTNGTACQPLNNLCISGAACTNGQCTGGTATDCFFLPVPDNCHVGQCDPMDGLCHVVVGNEGGPCTDQTDLCTVGKTCMTGMCQGGTPMDCTTQTWPTCQSGVCDPQFGVCVAQNLSNGTACNDANFCTNNDTCQNGSCTGGMQIPNCTTVTRDAIHRGWWNDVGSHTSSNNNTLTGRSANLYNSYFIFSLTGVTGTVIGAHLNLEIEAYTSTDASETLSVWDVTTPWATLEASGNSVAIYNDLMSGIQFGGFTVASTNVGQVMTIPLNASALAAIQAALGQNFSVGAHNDTVGGNTSEWVRFSAGSEARIHQLVVYRY